MNLRYGTMVQSTMLSVGVRVPSDNLLILNEAHDGWYRLHEVRPAIEVPG